jgi:predicted DNA repair protein MutK
MIATIGVYGIVALIVRMDDFGIKLIDLNEQDDSFSDKVGALLVRALPWVIKALSVIGTLALVLVSGGIFVHNLHFLEEYMPNLPILLNEFVVGLIVGGLALAVVSGVKKIIKK